MILTQNLNRGHRFTDLISVETYREEFLNGDDLARRSMAKTISQQIEKQLVEATINAPNWYVYDVSRLVKTLTVLLIGIPSTVREWRAIYCGKKKNLSTWMTSYIYHRRAPPLFKYYIITDVSFMIALWTFSRTRISYIISKKCDRAS